MAAASTWTIGKIMFFVIAAYLVYQLYQSSQSLETTTPAEAGENVQLVALGLIVGYLGARQ